MAEPEKPESKPQKITLTITIPTKEDVITALTKIFPGIHVEVEGKEKTETQEQP